MRGILDALATFLRSLLNGVVSGDLESVAVALALASGGATSAVFLSSAAIRGFASLRALRVQARLRQRRANVDARPEEIMRAVRYWVPPRVSSVDPVAREHGRSLLGTEEAFLTYVDRLLRQSESLPFLLLLSDSGMGKSTALLNLLAKNLGRRHSATMAYVNCFQSNAEQRIAAIDSPEHCVLCIDAVDEDVASIPDTRARLLDLLKCAALFRAVIVTCRSQYFRAETDVPRRTGLIRVSTGLGEEQEWELQVAYLLPFNNAEVRRFIRRRYAPWALGKRTRARATVERIGDLSSRPLVLAYLDDLVQPGTTPQTFSQIVGHVITQWIKREERFVPDGASLRHFSRRVAWEIVSHRLQRGSETIPVEAMSKLAQEFGIKLDEWQMEGRSLLTRDGPQRFRFAHRCFLEFLFVEHFVSRFDDLVVDVGMPGHSPAQAHGDSEAHLARRDSLLAAIGRDLGAPWSEQMGQFLQEAMRTRRPWSDRGFVRALLDAESTPVVRKALAKIIGLPELLERLLEYQEFAFRRGYQSKEDAVRRFNVVRATHGSGFRRSLGAEESEITLELDPSRKLLGSIRWREAAPGELVGFDVSVGTSGHEKWYDFHREKVFQPELVRTLNELGLLRQANQK